MFTPITNWTDPTTLPMTGTQASMEDDYELYRLNCLSAGQRSLVERHNLDQFNAVPSYLQRYAKESQNV